MVQDRVIRRRGGTGSRPPGLCLRSRHLEAALLAAALAAASLSAPTAARGQEPPLAQIIAGNACTATAMAAQLACRSAAEGDYWITIGRCANLSDSQARSGCLYGAVPERNKGRNACGKQFDVRLELCSTLGEAAYDPAFEPTDFVDPLQIGVSVPANLFFPLEQGRTWIYWSVGETITVSVTSRIRRVGGVTCLAVNGRVADENGAVVEDTDGWYGQQVDGTVWSCGKTLREAAPSAIALRADQAGGKGSWQAFRRFAKPGVIMSAAPRPGDVFRREFALGDAEDAAEVLSITGSAEVPGASCAGDCLVTRDFTPLEPGMAVHRYFAPGIGLILEVDPDTGQRRELVSVRLGAANSQ